DARRAVDIRPGHQRLYPLVGIAETLLHAHDGLAARREPEMPGFDDAGMHRPDGDPVQVLAFCREEFITHALTRDLRGRTEWAGDTPASVVEPGARVFETGREETGQITQRPLEPDRRG